MTREHEARSEPAVERDAPSRVEIRTSRALALAGGAVYLGWWFIVEALQPQSYNPFLERVVVVGLWWAVILASWFDARIARRLPLVLAVGVWLITAQFFVLVWRNPIDSTWWAGSLVTVAACAASLRRVRALLAYSGFVLVLALVVAIDRGLAGRLIFLPMLASLLVLLLLILRAGLDVERERAATLLARQERDRAEEANRAKSLFLSLVSHELLTPLQTLRLTTDALAEESGATPTRLARISRSVQRLSDLIGSLLDYARADAERMHVDATDFDLADLVSETAGELAPLATAKHLEMHVHAEGAPGVVHSDPKLVRVVVTNLVSNAIKYTERGTIDIEVGPRRISVRDSGPGIPLDDRERIFEPFTQLEPLQRKHVPGVGLGLALVRELAKALGARVEVSSDIGVGSRFTFSIPEAPPA